MTGSPLTYSSPCCVARRRSVTYLLNVGAFPRFSHALPDNEYPALSVFLPSFSGLPRESSGMCCHAKRDSFTAKPVARGGLRCRNDKGLTPLSLMTGSPPSARMTKGRVREAACAAEMTRASNALEFNDWIPAFGEDDRG